MVLQLRCEKHNTIPKNKSNEGVSCFHSSVDSCEGIDHLLLIYFDQDRIMVLGTEISASKKLEIKGHPRKLALYRLAQ